MEEPIMFTLFQICHIVTCAVIALSLLVGLTRKDQKQINIWHWVNRIALIVMAIGGIAMEIMILFTGPTPAWYVIANALVKCALGFMTIYLMEKTFRYKKDGTLNKGKVICLLSSYALTAVCGFVLLFITGGFGAY